MYSALSLHTESPIRITILKRQLLSLTVGYGAIFGSPNFGRYGSADKERGNVKVQSGTKLMLYTNMAIY